MYALFIHQCGRFDELIVWFKHLVEINETRTNHNGVVDIIESLLYFHFVFCNRVCMAHVCAIVIIKTNYQIQYKVGWAMTCINILSLYLMMTMMSRGKKNLTTTR